MSEQLQSARESYGVLLEQQRSLVLATVNASDIPEASYAPFVTDGQSFYIFVSQLSNHTNNLLVARQVSVMLVEDEMRAKQIFARTRVTAHCSVTEMIESEDVEKYTTLLNELQARHGDVVGMLRGLADFKLLRLTPVEGRLVLGFGRAYRIMFSRGLGADCIQLKGIGPK